jgi:hypothetical protein
MRNWLAFGMAAALLAIPGPAFAVGFDPDGDSDVDLVDFEHFYGCLLGPDTPGSGECVIHHDDDLDGNIDLVDFMGFMRAFTGEIVVGDRIPTELAGNSLTAYPYFEYVKAFNVNATVEVAIDPTRFPAIVGETCDIYIVEAKTASQWSGDSSLTDVTPGGAQTETFGGTTIQDNTFLVTGPYDLNADAGTGLGVGYDVVLDCDQDGELGDGDYIDGLSTEAGLYAVHDFTELGPLGVTEVQYSGGTWLGQDTYYPSNIGSMGQLPLIVISHGNGHDYRWYDHLGNFFASYGYICMSHTNETGPGIETASTTTLTNTDYIIENQGSIAGGALDGHIDTHKIVWIGHSRGAEGITRAYDRIYDGAWTPDHYTIDDLLLLSSMLPTDFLGTNNSNPHGANYHLWTAAGDADVSGDPGNDIAQTYHLHDRATGYRMSTTVQGTGHAWFHDYSGGSPYFTGPCPIYQENTHLVQFSLFLPLVKYYVDGNIPATDYFWRQYEDFRAIGVPTGGTCSVTGGDSVVVTSSFHNGATEGHFVIDDYQSADSESVSSSGGTVSYNVTNLYEGRLDDNNTSFTWTSSDPMNGFTYGRSTDTTRGVVFDWDGSDRYYEQGIVSDAKDFTPYKYLSFRGAQGTRHPNTIAVIEDLTFSITLRDLDGVTSTISIGAYGNAGVEEPYQRTGAGTGTGWGNEFETNRIRLTDFLNNGSGLDLTRIAAVRFDVGPSYGSDEGRLGLDDIELTSDFPPMFVPLTISLPGGAPEFVPPGVPIVIDVFIDEGTDALVEGSAKVHYRYQGGAFEEDPLTSVGGGLFQATLPPPTCADTPEYYFSAEAVYLGPTTLPASAPAAYFTSYVGTQIIVIDDNFETDMGWTVESFDLTSGEWERGVPLNWGRHDPPADYDGSGQCYLTDNDPTTDNSDVDGGPTILTSPMLDMSGLNGPILRYARWWANDDQDADPFDVEISSDGGTNWVMIEHVINIPDGWVFKEWNVEDFITPTAEMKVRFSCMDNPSNSIDEGGVDTFQVFAVECSD